MSLQVVSTKGGFCNQRFRITHYRHCIDRLGDGRVDLLASTTSSFTDIPGHDYAQGVELIEQRGDTPWSQWLDRDFHAGLTVGSVCLTCRDVSKAIILIQFDG